MNKNEQEQKQEITKELINILKIILAQKQLEEKRSQILNNIHRFPLACACLNYSIFLGNVDGIVHSKSSNEELLKLLDEYNKSNENSSSINGKKCIKP